MKKLGNQNYLDRVLMNENPIYLRMFSILLAFALLISIIPSEIFIFDTYAAEETVSGQYSTPSSPVYGNGTTSYPFLDERMLPTTTGYNSSNETNGIFLPDHGAQATRVNNEFYVTRNGSGKIFKFICADPDAWLPMGSEHGENAISWMANRDNAESALAFSMIHESVSGITLAELGAMLGETSFGSGGNRDNNWYHDQIDIMHYCNWIYESYTMYKYFGGMLSLSQVIANISTKPNEIVPDFVGPGGHDIGKLDFNSAFNSSPSPLGKNGTARAVTTAMNMLNNMINQPQAEMQLIYTPGTGTLYVSSTGYIQPGYLSLNPAAIDLTWTTTGTLNITVTRNGTPYTNGTTGLKVAFGDTLTVTRTGSGNVSFNAVDSRKYLLKNSVKGDILKNTAQQTNPLQSSKMNQAGITGWAEFVNLTSGLIVTYGNDVPSGGQLKLTKEVWDFSGVGLPWNKGESFNFKVEFTGGATNGITSNSPVFTSVDGGKTWTGTINSSTRNVTFNNIPDGVIYTITELSSSPANYNLFKIKSDHALISSNLISGKSSGRIKGNDLTEVIYVNLLSEKGETLLYVSKTVEDGYWDENDEFTFEISFHQTNNQLNNISNIVCSNSSFTSRIDTTFFDNKFMNVIVWSGVLTKDTPDVMFSNIPNNTEYGVVEALPSNSNYELKRIIVKNVNARIFLTNKMITGCLCINYTNEINFVNTSKATEKGSLSLTKDLTTDSEWGTNEFEFIVKFTGSDLNSITDPSETFTVIGSTSNTRTWSGKLNMGNSDVFFRNIPLGTTYEITETSLPQDFKIDTITSSQASISNTTTGIISGNIPSTTRVDVKYINKHTPPPEYGSLKITKNLAGKAWDSEAFAFEVKFTGTGDFSNVNASNTALTASFDKKTWTGTLTSANKEITFTNLPVGATYTIKETKLTNYELTDITVNGITQPSSLASGEITGSIESTVLVPIIYKNTYKAPPGSLKIIKEVDGTTWVAGTDFTFSVVFTGSNLDSITSDNSSFTKAGSGTDRKSTRLNSSH